MKVYILSNKKLVKYELPTSLEEFYSLEYQPDTLSDKITITFSSEENSKNWSLRSNGVVNVIENNTIIEKVELEYYKSYYIKILGVNNMAVVYAMPSQETELYNLAYDDVNAITIGNDSSSNINYNNPLSSKLDATIVKKENNWFINVEQTNKTGVFINGRRITSSKLKYGDVIFINALKIIWMPSYLKINNPSKLVSVTGLKPYTTKVEGNNFNLAEVSDEDAAKELYEEDDYFYHIPRIKETVEHEMVTIDSPPTKESMEDMPFLLQIGTSLTLIASSFITGYNLYNNISSGKKTITECIPQIIALSAMVIGSVIMPRAIKAYTKRLKRKREKERQKKYTAYLKSKEAEISDIMKKQTNILNDTNDSVIKCREAILKKDSNIWCRQIKDNDFLTVRLGIGEIPTALDVEAPTEHFTMEEDNLFEEVYRVVNESKKIKNVPITYSLLKETNTSMIFNCPYKREYINGIMTQLMALYSGADLKIVILTDEANKEYWNYAKILPHCWSDDKSLRFFATDISEYNEISNYLSEEFQKRKDKINNKNQNKSDEKELDKEQIYYNFSNYYLIITDVYKNTKNLPIFTTLLEESQNFGFSLLTISDTMKNLPKNCENFIVIGEKESCIMKKELSSSSQKKFVNEYVTDLDMESLSSSVANIPLMLGTGVSVLPTSLSFLEMFKVSRIEQLNISNRWHNNNPVTSLSTVIGVHENGEDFRLDLHEKFHGPHGLVAGSTGSGKSEFIITYILSMALNYHPYEVQFILIDYKGGGLAGAFENKETGVKLPHLVGTITNLDTSEMNRTLVSIESELKRRQKVFNEVRDQLGESTIDIYKYQRLYREGAVKEPMAHLFIISDEFAELKAQQPEFMTQLISTARIGRSLGMHLILATQKPSGVVNDQIWSNSKFKVCLKVQDRGDSMEMLKKPDAASIKDAGRFYLQVGYDDYFDIGQSGWGGAKYIPSDKIIKKFDDSINFVNNVGYVIKSANDAVKKETTNIVDMGDQLTNLVKYIYQIGEKNSLKTKQLWLPKIPDEININDIKTKYNYKPVPYKITPVIGEYDKPAAQQQGLLYLDLSGRGNALIYGQSGSGKENLLTTLMWSVMAEHTPDEVNMYVIDCGAEVLKMFYKIPHVGEIATIDETDKIVEIIKLVSEELEHRKDLFADYAGSYTNYLENSGNKLPLIIVIINNYDMFVESYYKLSEEIQTIYRECHKYGIVFVISALTSGSIRSRMAQNFDNKICMQLPNDSDYRTLLNSPKGLFPSKVFGRGIVSMDDTGYEFQTATICDTKSINNVIKQAAEKLNSYYTTRAKKIVTIPEVVTLNSLKDNVKSINKLPIGYDIEAKEIAYYNFLNEKINLVLSNSMGEKLGFTYAIIKELLMLKCNVTIIDFVDVVEKSIPGVRYINSDFDNAMKAISMELSKEKENQSNNFYIFIGMGDYKARLSESGVIIANNIFMNVNVLEKTNFIFVDNYNSYKKLLTETWYQTKINSDMGIWLGEGVSSQSSINVTNITIEDRKLDFEYMAFVINKSRRTIVKYIFDVEGEEQNEK